MTIGNLSASYPSKKKSPSNSNNPLQHNGPVATIPQDLKASKDVFWTLRGTLREQTQSWKFLISKIVHEGMRSLDWKERFLLYLLHDRLSNVKDRGWVEKYWNWFRQTVSVFNYFTLFLKQEDCPKVEFDRVLKDPFFSGGALSAHAYFGRKKFFNVKNVLRRVNLKLRKRPPPKRFVGVGYRDHGTARDVATDGSPTWQEVAVVHLGSVNTSPAEETAYRTYLWKCSGAKLPYQFFSPQIY